GATHGFGSAVWVVVALEDDLRREKTHFGEMPYFGIAPRSAWEELAVLAAYHVLERYKTPKPEDDLARLADKNLARYGALVDLARAAGARVLLVWHPTADALANGRDPYRERFLALAKDPGVDSLDLTAAYQAAGGNVYVDGMHLSVDGHRVAGKAIGGAVVGLVRTD